MAVTGRPTKYSNDMLTKSREYLVSCVDNYKIVEYGRSGQIMWDVKFPSHAGLCRHLGVNRSTLYEWAKHHEAFSNILDDILQEQEKRLLEQGLAGNYNSTIAKLVLAKHGYRDAQDITTNGKDLAPVTVDSTIAAKYASPTPTTDSPQ